MRFDKRLRRGFWQGIAKAIHSSDKKGWVASFLLRKEYDRQLGLTSLISSRGFLHHSDIKCASPESSSKDLWNIELLLSYTKRKDLGQGPGSLIPTIYVCTDALRTFVQRLRALDVPSFLLLTGDSDLSVSEALNEGDLGFLTGHPRLVAWYAQNCDASHERLHPLPIGLDYHTGWERSKVWGQDRRLPLTQEAELLAIWRESTPWVKRLETPVYSDWSTNLSRGDRQLAWDGIDKALLHVGPRRVTRSETWQMQTAFRYVSSPWGAGYDCHRTWEALALGAVPVVREGPWSKGLFDNLPVIQVREWGDLSAGLLKDFSSRVSAEIESTNYRKYLTTSFWLEKFKKDKESFHSPDSVR